MTTVNSDKESSNLLLLIISAVVVGQFIDVTLFSLGDNFAFSVQKAISIVVLFVGLYFFNSISISKALQWCGLAILLGFSGRHIIDGSILSPAGLKGLLVVVENFVVAAVLYTALVGTDKGLKHLGETWVWVSVVSSILAVGQAAGLLPLFVVSDEFIDWRETDISGVYRGTGFKFDPNFLAMLLGIGFVFALFPDRKYKVLIALVIISGVFATFSRMGVLALLLILFVWFVVRAKPAEGKFSQIVILMGLMTFATYGGFLALKDTYVGERVEEAVAAVSQVEMLGDAEQKYGRFSALERLALAWAAVKVIGENPLLGIGAYKEREVMYDAIGIEKSSHNTFLELIMIGGVFGWAFLLIAVLSFSTVLHRRPDESEKLLLEDRAAFFGLSASFLLFGMFLSFIYYQLLFLPIVVASAYRRTFDMTRAHNHD